MKKLNYIKLFENFVLENYDRGKSFPFGITDLYEMPSGLSKDKFYAIKMVYGNDEIIYALVDYSQLESLYNSLNLNLISDKIYWYATTIFQNVGDIEYAKQVLYEKEWDIEVLAETVADIFPYYVYVPGKSDSPSVAKKIQDLTKECKVCGDAPSVLNILPGQNAPTPGSNILVFDPGMGMKLSDIIYDDSGTHDKVSNTDHIFKGEGFYIRFDSLGLLLAYHNPAYANLERFNGSDKFIYAIPELLEIITYKHYLVSTREELANKKGSRDFMDDVFGYLVDSYVPNQIIKAISNVLNPDEYKVDTLVYNKIEVIYYGKGWSEKDKKYSEYPNYGKGRFYLALSGNKEIANSVIEKLPKDYEEIYAEFDSLDRSDLFLKRVFNKSKLKDMEDFIERNLKSYIYLIDPSSLEEEKIKLYDEKIPSNKVLRDDTDCQFFYGVNPKITMEEINRLSPIQLYLTIFYGG